MGEKSEIFHDVAAALYSNPVEAQMYRVKLGIFTHITDYFKGVHQGQARDIEEVAHVLEISTRQVEALLIGLPSKFTIEELIALSTKLWRLHPNANDEPQLIFKIEHTYAPR